MSINTMIDKHWQAHAIKVFLKSLKSGDDILSLIYAARNRTPSWAQAEFDFLQQFFKLSKEERIKVYHELFEITTYNNANRQKEIVSELTKYGETPTLFPYIKNIPEGFFRHDTFQSVVRTDNPISIQKQAFFESETIKTLMIPQVSLIGDGAFQGCKNLKLVSLSDRDGVNYNLKQIGEKAFHGCELIKKIVIPEGVTTIKNQAFCGCTNLTTVILPTTIRHIESSVFDGCNKDFQIVIKKPLIGYPSQESEFYKTHLTDFEFNDVQLQFFTYNMKAIDFDSKMKDAEEK